MRKPLTPGQDLALCLIVMAVLFLLFYFGLKAALPTPDRLAAAL